MGSFQVVLSGIVTIVVYSLIMAGVFKLFQIATNLSEIKDLLQDIKRNTQDIVFTGVSPAELISPVKAESSPSQSLVSAAVDTET